MKNLEVMVLMADNCTESEAIKHLNNGTVVLDEKDFTDNFDYYMESWDIDDESVEEYRNMIETKKPIQDWGVAEVEETVYFIMYAL